MPELPCASVSKQVLVQNCCYENEFDLHENRHVGGIHFQIHEWCHTKTRFETKAFKGNLEMAYLHCKYTVLCMKSKTIINVKYS